VKRDNVGAMFMAQNASSGVRMRNIDTNYHYVREKLKEGVINIEFVKSIENDSDIFKKNLSQEIYDKHVTKFLGVHNKEYKH
jgi:DNA-dependent RNA polymerase auxiliary subunit epsilon